MRLNWAIIWKIVKLNNSIIVILINNQYYLYDYLHHSLDNLASVFVVVNFCNLTNVVDFYTFKC